MATDNLISIEKLIETASKKGVDFGKGDPYNRLRYYTKIGLLPHMQRKVVGGEVVGHYPVEALDIIIEIEKLKKLGVRNDEIANKIKGLTSGSRAYSPASAVKLARVLTPSPKALRIIAVLVFVLLVMAGFGVLPVGKSKSELIQRTLELDKKYMVDTGTAYVPKDQNKVFIKSTNVKLNSRINLSFSANYTPAARYWVSQRVPFEGFYVELDAPVAADAEFSWWISN